MSITSDFWKAMNQSGTKVSGTSQKSSGGSANNSDGGSSNKSTQKKKKKTISEEFWEAIGDDDIAPVSSVASRVQARANGVLTPLSDLAPVASQSVSKKDEEEEKQKWYQGWFQKGTFEDGYDQGDVSKAILGTLSDVGQDFLTGIVGMGETALDSLMTIAPYTLMPQDQYMTPEMWELQNRIVEEAKKESAEFVKKDLYDERAVANKILSNLYGGFSNMQKVESGQFLTAEDISMAQQQAKYAQDYLDNQMELDSVLGDKSDALVQSAGVLAAQAGLQAVGVPWYLTSGVTSFGAEAENAFNQGATNEQAVISSAVSAAGEILSEKMFGGDIFTKNGADIATNYLSRAVSNKIVRNLMKAGYDIAGEGFEEAVSEVISRLGSSVYKDEKLKDILLSEEAVDSYIESAIGGMVLGGGMTAINVSKSNAEGVDYTTGLTANEQKVVDKVYQDRLSEVNKDGKVTRNQKKKIYNEVRNDLEKGYISTDTIEEVLGDKDYQTYRETVDREDSLIKEFEELGNKKNATLSEQSRYSELQQNVADIKKYSTRESLKKQLSESVYQKVQGDRLVESYNERARRGQRFEADLTKYDAKQQQTIQNAINSGTLNNTNRTHELVDFIAKISADKGVLFDFTNNEKIKGTQFAVEGKIVNGYVTDSGITLNVESPKYLESTVGHEVTHILEGTELYDALKTTIFEYAKSKGEYDSRMADLTKMYENIEGADVEAELTADLVGDYLFRDADFVNKLSTENRNVFQKIYDEIKYLCRVATAGSKEARELEKVKKVFEDAYRASGKQTGTKHSISETTDGRSVAVVDNDILSHIDTSKWGNETKSEAKKAANEVLRTFSDGFSINGIEYVGNKKSRDEYIRSNYSEALARKNPEAYLDKMRAASVLDDVVRVATDWSNDGYLTHDRPDYVDFIRGKTLIMSGDHTYSAVVLAGIRENGQAVFHDVEDIYPDSFEIKESEPSTAVATNESPNAILESSDGGNVAQKGKNVKYSLSDSDGKQLTNEQQEFFKDSKMRDENGNLKVMYHGSQDAGFHVFDASMSDDGKSFFFVDRNDVASSYSGTSETYEAKTIRTAEDMNNFLSEIGYDQYEAVENNGKFELLENGDHVAWSDTAQGIYEEFCWYEGVGEGEANYKVYLNLNNPLEVDAQGRNWNNISREFSQDVYDRYQSLTAEEKAALVDLAEWGEYGIFKDEMLAAAKHDGSEILYNAYEKLGGANANLYDAFSIASDKFSEGSLREFAVKQMNTRDYAKKAKAEGYDGVIFNNIVDNGGYSNGSEGASTVAIAFESNQIKSVANEKPTADKDIRYSLSDSNGNKLSQKQIEYFKDSKARDENGNLKVMYHGTPNGDFTVFKDGTYFTDNKEYADTYQNPGASSISSGKVASDPKTFEVYLDIKKPFDINDAEARSIYINDYIKGGNAMGINPYLSDAEYDKITTIDWTEGEDLREFLVENGYDYDGLVLDEGATGGYGDEVKSRGKSYVVFSPEQVKNIDNLSPTTDPDIRYSLTEYTPEEKKAHNKAVMEHFGRTYKWAETGYVLLDGSKLDLSGKHEGAPGGYRSVDHRDIVDALGSDYGDGSYSGSLVQFMSEGNIRISPECDGINLSIKPTKAQEQSLSDFISRARGEVLLDIDNLEGYTVVSVEYPRGTHANKVLNDIREWFDNGKKPEVSNLSQFRSLSNVGDTPYGNRGTLGKDVAYVDPNATNETTNATTNTSSMLSSAPVTGETEVTEVTEVTDLFPDEPTPQTELDSLIREKESLESRMLDMANAGDFSQFNSVNDRYMEVTARISELENEISESEFDRFNSLGDADVPPEIDAPYFERNKVKVDNPFYDRDWREVGSQKVKAFMTENPEVKPFFQDAALGMMYDINNGTKGERFFNEQLHYESGGEKGWMGVKRRTTDDIADLLDGYGWRYADIENGLNGIIDDKPNAFSKRLEFLLNDRLMKGYTDVEGRPIPPNQDYINLLNEMQVNKDAREAFDSLMPVADQYAPEDVAPFATSENKPLAPATPDTMNAPIYQSKDPAAVNGQTTMFEPPKPNPKVAKVLTEESAIAKEKSGIGGKLVSALVDKGMVFENLSLETGNHELQSKYNYALPSNTEARAQYLMEHGDGDVKSLKEIKDRIEKTGKTHSFSDYLYHVHNIDRMTLADRFADTPNKPVFGETVTADVSRKKVAQYEKNNPSFKSVADDIYKYNAYLRKMLVDNGVISQETSDLWQKMYPHYVPIRRVDTTGQNINVPLDTNKTGVNAPIKRATGGSSDIQPLFETMAMRTEQTYRAIARNSFGIELKNTLGTTIDSQADAVGVDGIIDTIEQQEEKLLNPGTMFSSPTFTVFENGERVEFEITEDMYDALKPAGKLLGYRNSAVKSFGDARRNLLTVWNPVFALYRNPIKDIQDVAINSQHAAKTYANIPNAIYQMATGGEYATEYHKNGGKSNTYFDGRTHKFKQEDNVFKKIIGMPVRAIENAGEFIEEIPRLAEYIASRKEGRSVERSMLDAARVTTNFAAGGDFTKLLNSHGFTFLNASVQGASQHVRNFREAKQQGLKGYVKVLSKYVVAGLPGILLNNLLWDDDDEYEELSDYVKQNYYVVAKTQDGKFVRIPKGRTAAVMGELMNQMENLVTGDDEVDFSTFFDLFMNNIAPNNPLDNNILAPVVQTITNNAWYGGDIVPSRLQNVPADEQYDESTDSISKWLGEATGTSPYKWNYLIDQYSGGLGDVFLPMLTPEAESGDNSILGNFLAPWKKEVTTDAVLNNKYPGDFYDIRDELEVKSNSKDATEEDAMRTMYMDSVSWDMSDLYKQKREVQNSDLPDDEKYEEVRRIQDQINDLAKNAMSGYNNVHIDGLYSEVGDRRYNKDEESGKWYEIHSKNADGSDNWYYQKEQEVTQALGISYGEYWNNREEYNYAYDKPEQYALSKAVGGYQEYRGYTSDLWDIKADKDENGKSINGSRKEKVIEYLNSLDIDYYHKIILFKNEYNADDTYNMEIIDYLNGREDISYEEMESILKYLGFNVDSQGNITWD